jgi:hypothetical protein
MAASLVKLRCDPAPVLAMAQLEPAETRLVAGAADGAAAITILAGSGRIDAALKLCAFALPRREAVWWACMCAAYSEGEAAAAEIAARQAAELGVRRDPQPARLAAGGAAPAAGFGSPHAWAAVAAFWCGRSMAPQGEPEVPPAAHLAGTAVHGAIALAAVRPDVARRAGRLQRFLAAAQDIADGGAGQIGREAA